MEGSVSEDDNVSRSSEDSRNMARNVSQGHIQNQRLRQKNIDQHVDQEARKKSQDELQLKKLEELKARYERNEIQGSVKKEKVKKMGEIQAYQAEKQIPKDLKPGLLYVDKVHNTILVPYNSTGAFVPFHVSTIKNVSTTNEGQWTFLRLNFHIPGGSTLQFPETKDPNSIFVKELTLKNQSTKSGGENHLITASKSIKELIKKVKDQDSEETSGGAKNGEGAKGDQQVEELITIKGKKEILENLVIRPNIVGKKTVGNLEIH